MYRTIFSSLCLSLVALSACAPGTSADAGVAAEAVDSTSLAQTEASLLVPSVDGAVATDTPEAIATAAAGKAPTFYQPASCVTATASGATVSYALQDCSGPFGLAHVSGTIAVTYSVSAAGVGVSATGKGVGASGVQLDVDVQATYATSGSAATLTVQSTSSGTGPLGNTVSHEGSYTTTWDDATSCLGVTGTWTTTGALGRKWSTTVSGLDACAGECPASGGSIAYTGGILGESVTVDFTGGDTASWSTSAGRDGTIDLVCTPAK
jgi:hypothetical protein